MQALFPGLKPGYQNKAKKTFSTASFSFAEDMWRHIFCTDTKPSKERVGPDHTAPQDSEELIEFTFDVLYAFSAVIEE